MKMLLEKIEKNITKENKELLLMIEKINSEIYINFYNNPSETPDILIKKFFENNNDNLVKLPTSILKSLKIHYQCNGRSPVKVKPIILKNGIFDIHFNSMMGNDGDHYFRPSKDINIQYQFKTIFGDKLKINKNILKTKKLNIDFCTLLSYESKKAGLRLLLLDLDNSWRSGEFNEVNILPLYKKKSRFFFFKVKRPIKIPYKNIKQRYKSIMNLNVLNSLLDNSNFNIEQIQEQALLVYDTDLLEVEKELVNYFKTIYLKL